VDSLIRRLKAATMGQFFIWFLEGEHNVGEKITSSCYIIND
jgi:hypothetical protein